MNKLTEKDCAKLRDEVLYGRLTMSGMRKYLFAAFVVSGLFVGVSYAIANANTVGWNTLADGWHKLYYVEAILLIIHFLVIALLRRNSALNQKVLSLSVVVFTYKLMLDQYLVLLMFSKDRGTFDSFITPILWTFVIGLVFHVIVLTVWIKILKKDKSNARNSGTSTKVIIGLSTPVIFFLVTLTSYVVKNGLLGESELMFLLIVITLVTFA